MVRTAWTQIVSQYGLQGIAKQYISTPEERRDDQ